MLAVGEESVKDDTEYEMRYVVMVNGAPCGPRHLDPEDAEFDIQILDAYHRSIAEIVAVKVKKQPMTIDELIWESQTKSLTPAAQERFAERVRAREQKFEEEHNPIDDKLLNRRYTI